MNKDLISEEQLDLFEGVWIINWIGSDYIDYKRENRLLIVSYDLECDQDYLKIKSILFPGENFKDQKLYDKTASYTFLQVDNNPENEVTIIRKYWKILFQILNQYKPHYCLFLEIKLADYFPEAANNNDIVIKSELIDTENDYKPCRYYSISDKDNNNYELLFINHDDDKTIISNFLNQYLGAQLSWLKNELLKQS
jgi:hypothetical protein